MTTWIPESVLAPGLFATGKGRGRMTTATRDAGEAIAFPSAGACTEWCNARNTRHDRPTWRPREHEKAIGGRRG